MAETKAAPKGGGTSTSTKSTAKTDDTEQAETTADLFRPGQVADNSGEGQPVMKAGAELFQSQKWAATHGANPLEEQHGDF